MTNKYINYEIPINFSKKLEDNHFRNLLTKEFIKNEKKLLIALGEDEHQKSVYLDLDEVGHLIIAGAPRSGKSICLHTMLISLLLKNSYEDLKLILMDPKKVEFDAYKDLPHLAMPILMDTRSMVAGLKWVVQEIVRRRQLEKSELDKIPNIVIIADEYVDMIREYKTEVIDSLIQIAQKGSSVKIHLILSTVQPTIDTITGTLKANISTRIAFRVATDIDSKVIIDIVGAEELRGKGDMILKNSNEYIHLQGAHIDEFEILELCNYIKEKCDSSYLVSLEELNKIEVSLPIEEQVDEELLYQVALYCIETNMVSINAIQLEFGLRFNAVLEILNELEKRNIVSPKNGIRGRKVLVDIVELKTIMDI